jgi:hypothetical protein
MPATARFSGGFIVKLQTYGVNRKICTAKIEQSGVISAARLFTASAQQPERT